MGKLKMRPSYLAGAAAMLLSRLCLLLHRVPSLAFQRLEEFVPSQMRSLFRSETHPKGLVWGIEVVSDFLALPALALFSILDSFLKLSRNMLLNGCIHNDQSSFYAYCHPVGLLWRLLSTVCTRSALLFTCRGVSLVCAIVIIACAMLSFLLWFRLWLQNCCYPLILIYSTPWQYCFYSKGMWIQALVADILFSCLVGCVFDPHFVLLQFT